MDNDVFYTGLWAGTQASLDQYQATLARVVADGSLAAAAASGRYDQRGPDAPRLYSQQGDIGVVTVAGPLNNSDSWMNEFMGFTGYPEIRSALIHAVSDPSVKRIVLDVKSGGGTVSGCADIGALIRTISTQAKRIDTYGDTIASAAYWLGVSAESVTIGSVSEAGSIGVLVMHQERSKMLADAGITVNVIRSGKFKALGNGAEALSDLGRESIQAKVDYLAGLFTAHVADALGTTEAIVDKTMGQGRVFTGQQAVDVGLVHAVATFDAFMSKVQGEIDSAKQPSKYGANHPKGSMSMPNTALTAQAIAALAAGAVAGAAAPTPEEILAATALADQAAADAAVAAAAADAAAAAKPANTEVVALLQSQLASAQGQVVQLNVDLQGARAAADSTKLSAEVMRPIVRAAVGNLRIALGSSAAGVEALADENLVAEHANLAAQFGKKFKAGGVAAVTTPAQADKPGADLDDPIRQARLAATRNRK